jgi:hypothetical protein
MEIMIKNGNSGDIALVDERKRLHTQAVTFSATQQATTDGRSFNINTGWISISAESAILFFKNDEDADFVIDAIAMGVKDGDTNDIGWLTAIRNPTAGDIVTNALAVDMNQNRNFGSSALLKTTTLAYKGATGNSFTDGDDIAMFAQGDRGRLFATVDFDLPRGSSIGLRYEPSLASGTVEVYAAIIGFIKDPKLQTTI